MDAKRLAAAQPLGDSLRDGAEEKGRQPHEEQA
jgi:hypothetical protein